MIDKSTRTKILAFAIAAFTLAACDNGEPPKTYFTRAELFVAADGDIPGQRIIDEIASADRVLAAFETLSSEPLTNAIIAAHERGALVQIVGDEDSRGDSGFAALVDADVPVTFGDGELSYLPEPTINTLLDNCGIVAEKVRCPAPQGSEPVPPGSGVYRPGQFNIMSHSFILLNNTIVWNFSRGASAATNGPIVGYRIDSEYLWETYERNHRQMFGGNFSIDLDVYNGPATSDQQSNPTFQSNSYLSDIGEFQSYFSPFDKTTKRMIDETYRARASVYVMTDNLAEEAMVRALLYKERNDFDVRVIINNAAQSSETDLDGLDVRVAPSSFDALPTVLVYDAVPDRNNDLRPRQVMVVSHPIYKTSPFRVLFGPAQNLENDIVEIYPSDYFIDGNSWGLIEYQGQLHQSPEIDRFEAFFNSVWEQSEAL